MAKFLIKASYTNEGLQAIRAAGPTTRPKAVEELAASVGGKMEAFYFAFGDTDAYVIVDLPDNGAAAAIAGAVGSTNVVREYSTVVLMTPEEMEEALRRPATYRPPGS